MTKFVPWGNVTRTRGTNDGIARMLVVGYDTAGWV